jgi:hypothetical protein
MACTDIGTANRPAAKRRIADDVPCCPDQGLEIERYAGAVGIELLNGICGVEGHGVPVFQQIVADPTIFLSLVFATLSART